MESGGSARGCIGTEETESLEGESSWKQALKSGVQTFSDTRSFSPRRSADHNIWCQTQESCAVLSWIKSWNRSGFTACRRCSKKVRVHLHHQPLRSDKKQTHVLTCETPALKTAGLFGSSGHTITAPPRPAHSCQIPSGEEAQSGRSMSDKLRAEKCLEEEDDDEEDVRCVCFNPSREERRSVPPAAAGQRAVALQCSRGGEGAHRAASVRFLRHLPNFSPL